MDEIRLKYGCNPNQGSARVYVEENGNRCFVLTLAAREQHIRREKATNQLFAGQHNQRYIGIFFHILDLMRIYPIRAPIQTHNFYHTIFYANSPTVKYLRVFYRNFRDKKPPYYYIGVYFN